MLNFAPLPCVFSPKSNTIGAPLAFTGGGYPLPGGGYCDLLCTLGECWPIDSMGLILLPNWGCGDDASIIRVPGWLGAPA